MYCIALKKSKRLANVTAEFRKHELDVKILQFDRMLDGKRGCFESHQAALRMGVEKGYPSIVVFEDDVTFCCPTPSFPRKANDGETAADLICRGRVLVERDPWLVVGLGGLVTASFDTVPVEWNFYRARFAAAHAYVVSRQAAIQILQLQYNSVHFDMKLQQVFENNMLVCLPTVAYQKAYFFDEVTSTETSLPYFFLTLGRNLLHPLFVQRVFEVFWWIVSCVRLRLSH